VLNWEYDNVNYHRSVTHYVTGNIRHKTIGSSDKSSNFYQGHWTSVTTTKSTGYKSTSSGTANSNLVLDLWTPPVSLSAIPSELILNDAQKGGYGRVTGDFLTLLDAAVENSEWLACYYAASAFKFLNIASLEQGRDFYRIRDLIPPIRSILSAFSPKEWADIYLWFKFGILPTLGNAREITRAFIQLREYTWAQVAKLFATCTCRYGTALDSDLTVRGHKTTHRCNAKLLAQPRLQPENELEMCYLLLKALGIDFTATNVWELIPYSFVTDWFLNTGRLTECLDYTQLPTIYDVKCLNISHKRELVVPAGEYYVNYNGNIKLSVYSRALYNTFPEEPFELRFTDPSGHWLEGAALLVSR